MSGGDLLSGFKVHLSPLKKGEHQINAPDIDSITLTVFIFWKETSPYNGERKTNLRNSLERSD